MVSLRLDGLGQGGKSGPDVGYRPARGK